MELIDLNREAEREPIWFSYSPETGLKMESGRDDVDLSFSAGGTVCDIEGAMARKGFTEQCSAQSTHHWDIDLPGLNFHRVYGPESGPTRVRRPCEPHNTRAAGANHLLIRQATEEDYPNIIGFLLESSSIYPEIGHWWEHQVRPSVEDGKRIVLIADSGPSLDGLFIGKIGDSAKICTLRLRESARNHGVGRVLVAEGLRHLLRYSPSGFHVTVSEGAEEGASPFFESIGFRQVAVERNRYVHGVDEFVYSCGRAEITEAVNNELSFSMERTLFGAHPRQRPGDNILLMSLKPEFADSILKGRKTVEFRRRFSKKYEGSTIVFYVTQPVKRFMFMGTISQVDHLPKAQLWKAHQHNGGVSKELFESYFSGTENGYGIHLSNVHPISNQLGLKGAQEIFPQWRPPQSFQRMQRKSPLLQALGLPISI